MTPPRAEQRCSRPDCPGFTDWRVVHPVEREGRTVIVDDVPAHVCFLCGETRLSDETRRRIEELLDRRQGRSLPFVEFE